MKNAVRNSKGFSLIEVMVSVAILSVVLAGITQATVFSQMQTTTADVKNSVASVTGYVGQIALNERTCTAAITKVPQSFGNPIRFDLADGQIIAANSKLTLYGVEITKFSYENSNLVFTWADGTKVYFGTLTLTMNTKKQVIGLHDFAPRATASVYIKVGPDDKIVSCGATQPSPPLPPVIPPTNPLVKTFDFDADPLVCENFPVKARCPAGSMIVVTASSYGANCAGVPANYGQGTVQTLCNGQQNCDFTAGNNDNCTTQGVFTDPAVDCPKSFHMTYQCK